MRWVGYVACTAETRKSYTLLVRKPELKTELGRLRRRLEDNIRMDLRKIGWGGVGRIYLVQDRDQRRAFMNTVMNLRVP
jgi:hypothetical protein